MTVRDAQYETEAVLDEYFYHPNVAPFLCSTMIRRLGVTSNPSARYVKTCVNAFRTGNYTSGGMTFGDDKYGNLEAMYASIVLDREAVDDSVKLDPSHGTLIEPIRAVIRLFRSMEYQTSMPDTLQGPPLQKDKAVNLWKISEKIGMGPYEFKSVFSWYSPDYAPAGNGPITAANLFSPEAQISIMPKIIGMLNGLISLPKYVSRYE